MEHDHSDDTPRVIAVPIPAALVEAIMETVAEQRDREIVEAIEDGRRILSALSTERDRLSRLLVQAKSDSALKLPESASLREVREARARERVARLTHDRAHTLHLIEQYIEALGKLPRAEGCSTGECIALPSGGVWQCREDYAARKAAERG